MFGEGLEVLECETFATKEDQKIFLVKWIFS